MAKVMVTIQSSDAPPTVAGIRERYGLAEQAIDPTFGVVEIDPVEHLYTILVDQEAAALIQPTEEWEVEGPYSNPRIEPFGPPEEA